MFTAAAAGGVATAMGFVIAIAAPAFASDPPALVVIVTGLVMAVFLLGIIAVLAAFVFAIGLFIVGLPAWAVLYQLGFRARMHAALAGGVLTGIAVAVVFPPSGLALDAAVFPILMSLPGAFAGWTFHRIAYGKPQLAAG